jgi:hypothetical protein
MTPQFVPDIVVLVPVMAKLPATEVASVTTRPLVTSKLLLPTVNAIPGAVVPIPTFPAPVIVIVVAAVLFAGRTCFSGEGLEPDLRRAGAG